VTDFDLIFTKLDETTTLGSILNICYATGKKVAYVTFGQNVPDDLEVIKPDKVAKSLLGLTKDTGYAYAHDDEP
jgi:flagellar biosynthesis protein FlhF